MSASTGSATVAPEPRRLRTDVFLMVGAKVLTIVLGLVTSVILARSLGASGRGTLAVAFNMTLLLVQLGTFGIVTANPYFASRDPGSIGRIVVNAIWSAAAIGLAMFAVGIAIRGVTPSVLQGVTWSECLVAFCAIPLMLAALFLQSILLGEGRTLAYNGVEAGTGVLGAVALVVALGIFHVGVLGALAVLAGQQLAAVVIYLLALRHHVDSSRFDLGLVRRMIGYSFRLYAATLAAYVVVRIDMFLVNGYLGAAEAGRYAVAVALADGMILIPTSVAVNLFPRVARGGETETSAEVFRSVALLFAILCAVTVPFAGLAVRILFGATFNEAAGLYLWLLPGIFSLGMLTILSHHFAGRGFPLEAMLIWGVGLAINIAINVVFLDEHGTYVAALSSSIAYALLLGLHVRLFAKETGSYRSVIPRFGETARMVKASLSRTP